MKRLALLLLAAGCGQNPLLKIASYDYAPFKVGSSWTYLAPDGSPGFERRLVASTVYAGKAASQMDTLAGGLTTTAYVAHSGSAIQIYSATDGWYTARKLPYVTGNRWDLPGSGSFSFRVYVEGNEDVTTPAGEFKSCYRLRTEIADYNSGTGVTTTTGALAWAAPGVGDVKMASLDSAGTVTVDFVLSQYSPGP